MKILENYLENTKFFQRKSLPAIRLKKNSTTLLSVSKKGFQGFPMSPYYENGEETMSNGG
jgi:hypothetical protein